MHRHSPLPRQHEIASSIIGSFVHAPSAPASLTRLAVELERGVLAVAAHPAGRSMLGELQASLFAAYGREREARALWHESLATAACAEMLASFNGASVGAASLGALLHRAGEAWMLRALASTEAQSGARLNNPSRARLSAREAAACAVRLGARLAALRDRGGVRHGLAQVQRARAPAARDRGDLLRPAARARGAAAAVLRAGCDHFGGRRSRDSTAMRSRACARATTAIRALLRAFD